MDKPKILLIEDDPDDIFLLEASFRKHGLDVELNLMTDGLKAAQLFIEMRAANRNELPHLIILDLNLPGISGLDLLLRLRNDSALAHLPVVILSSSINVQDVNAAKRLGAYAYFEKPLTRDAVLCIRQLCSSERKTASHVILGA